MELPELFDEPAARSVVPDAVREQREAYGAQPAPFFVDGARGVRLYLGDAMELLKRARGGPFDLIFADPPYFLSNDGITCQSGKMVSVNKGVWDRAETFEEVHAFNVAWLRECRRLLKPNGTIWVTGTSHNIYSVGYAMQTLGYKVLNDIAWYKVNPPPNLACRYFTHATETVLWARRDAKARHTFHYDVMKQMGDPTPGKQMQSLWRILPPAAREKRYGKHPTQKPEALLTRILLAASSPGDLVLDPFCGSGTTGVASARLDRRFVGFEVMLDYLRIALARITAELGSPRLFVVGVELAPAPSTETADKQARRTTWRDVVAGALVALGGEAGLRDINAVVSADPRTRTNPTWMATVRRVVRESDTFETTGRGRYRVRANMTAVAG